MADFPRQRAAGVETGCGQKSWQGSVREGRTPGWVGGRVGFRRDSGRSQRQRGRQEL